MATRARRQRDKLTKPRLGYDRTDLEEVVTWIEEADHDELCLKREHEAAVEAEKEKRSWD
jgi:hypothetical protein